jgi:hypothetical protein
VHHCQDHSCEFGSCSFLPKSSLECIEVNEVNGPQDFAGDAKFFEETRSQITSEQSHTRDRRIPKLPITVEDVKQIEHSRLIEVDPRNNHVHALSGDRQGFFHRECRNESGAIPNDRLKNFHGLWRIGDEYSLHVMGYHPMAETWLPFSLGREVYPAAKKPSRRLPRSAR